MTAPCTHGMPTPASCVECMNEGNMPAPPPKPTAEYTVTAQFAGRCPGCHEEIEIGDLIARVEDEWLCRRCTR